MSLNLNKVILAGRISKDIELKKTQSDVSVLSFSIAVDRKVQKDAEKKTDFIDIIAWRGTAEFISKYFRKGAAICVVGNIQTRSWQDKNGNNRYATEVIADEASFVESKATEQSASASIPSYDVPADANTVNLSEDDDLPF